MSVMLIAAITVVSSFAQLPDTCRLRLGTNLSGLFDWGTEIPFVDMMKMCRQWYTKAVDDPNWEFDTQQAKYLRYDTNGYPTHLPQRSPHHPLPQYVCTIWAVTDSWEPGTYTLLWEGRGEFRVTGPIQNWRQVNDSTITFDFPAPRGAQLELCILRSDSLNPVRNVRLIMPGHAATYRQQPFNPRWLQWVRKFKAVRFMDWGHTNNWGQPHPDSIDPQKTFEWEERSKPGYYTFTHSKGVPYEYMVKLMNDYDLDGWVCVPHSASPGYIRAMARFFRDNLEPERHLVVEFSNEIWNAIFGQSHWLWQRYRCEQGGNYWPECLVPAIQQALDIWTEEFAGQLHRITRAVGMFTSWLDVSRRIAVNLRPGSFDAVAPTYYFGISEESDALLDSLGSNAKVALLAELVRRDRAEREWVWIKQVVDSIAVPLGKKVYFYEGGQHITPIPFGVPSTYDQVLLDIQRDTAMYNLYVENYEYLKRIHRGTHPWWLMNFTLVFGRSAQFGSWGLLEDLHQDTAQIPAPKLSATLRYITNCTDAPQSVEQVQPSDSCLIVRQEGGDVIVVYRPLHSAVPTVHIYDVLGRMLNVQACLVSLGEGVYRLEQGMLPAGVYFLCGEQPRYRCCLAVVIR
ncbi:MAG: hypothetical protein RML15_09145 [Bacteroidota bacterium]|nr:hypothetical protein [Bacteroidota bacterium]